MVLRENYETTTTKNYGTRNLLKQLQDTYLYPVLHLMHGLHSHVYFNKNNLMKMTCVHQVKNERRELLHA